MTSTTTEIFAPTGELRGRRRAIGLLVLGLSLALLAASCQTTGNSSTSPADIAAGVAVYIEEVVPVELDSHQDCDGLLAAIKQEALGRVTPWGLEEPYAGGPEPVPLFARADGIMPEVAADLSVQAAPEIAASAAPTGEAGGSTEFSGTNIQVEGVDEADIVKTNGQIVVGLNSDGNTLWVADVSGSDPQLTGKVGLPDGYYQEMFLIGSKVILLGNGTGGDFRIYGEGLIVETYEGTADADTDADADADAAGNRGTSDAAADEPPAGSLPVEPARTSPPFYGPQEQLVIITEVDLSDISDPEPTRHLTIEGYYVSSRLADGQVRVVLRSRPSNKLGFVQPSYSGGSNDRAEDTALRVNTQIVEESTITDWLPEYTLSDNLENELASGLALDCDQVYVPEEFAGFNQISVLSLDASEPLELGGAAAVVADGETVYATAGNLYVAHVVRDFSFVPFPNRPRNLKEETVVHKFALGSGGQASYAGSGAVAGYPVNQFAFHEHNEHLFVATTVSASRANGSEEAPEVSVDNQELDRLDTSDVRVGASTSESYIHSLRDTGGQLELVDSVGELGPTETIHAVRYLGDKAYVVTFRQTDPLYVVDLSDPADLTTEGELKITGYSAYLHPIGEDMLLGVGQEATEEGRTTGTKFSLFDVSEPANPKVLDSLTFDDGYSGAEWDHRAFLWWAPENLAVASLSNHRESFYGAVAVKVTPSGGSYELSLAKEITHYEARVLSGDKQGCEWYKLPPNVYGTAIAKICPEGAEGGGDYYFRSAVGVPDNYNCWLREGRHLTSDRQEWEIEPVGPNEQQLKSTEELLAVHEAMSGDDFDRISLCHRDDSGLYRKSINRSLVIGSDLWTVSYDRLQANALDGFAIRDWVNLPE